MRKEKEKKVSGEELGVRLRTKTKKVVKKAVSIEKEAREGLRGLGPEALRGRVAGPEREREGRLNADVTEAASSRRRAQ